MANTGLAKINFLLRAAFPSLFTMVIFALILGAIFFF